jgi:hypothetical protein
MPPHPTAGTSGPNDLLVQFDELCALARDGITAGDYDVTAAALAAAELAAAEHRAQTWAAERLAAVRVQTDHRTAAV